MPLTEGTLESYHTIALPLPEGSVLRPTTRQSKRLICNFSTREAEAGGSQVQSRPKQCGKADSQFFRDIFILFYAYKCCAHMDVWVLCACNTHKGKKRVSEPMESELWLVVSCHMGTGN